MTLIKLLTSMISKIKRLRNKRYLVHVRQQACLACRRPWAGDAHHIMFAEPAAMSMKVSDNWVVPLCRNCHHDLHMAGNEKHFWEAVDRDPIAWATSQWKEWSNA